MVGGAGATRPLLPPPPPPPLPYPYEPGDPTDEPGEEMTTGLDVFPTGEGEDFDVALSTFAFTESVKLLKRAPRLLRWVWLCGCGWLSPRASGTAGETKDAEEAEEMGEGVDAAGSEGGVAEGEEA